MAQLGCVHCQDSEGDEVMGLSYITGEVKEASSARLHLYEHPIISSFFGRDTTFDMESMWAFKSMNAYILFFADVYIRNVCLHNCETQRPRIVYVCVYLFVQHF